MISDLREKIKEKQVTTGTAETIKQLRAGTLTEVYLTKNCPPDVREQIMHYAGKNNVAVVELDIDNVEFGTKGKKPFHISVIGVLA